jgi:membrane protease YdiL (CAAX protease family)
MPTEFDPAAFLASLIILTVIGSSLALWIHRIKHRRTVLIPSAGASAWSIGWVNFGLFLCAAILAISLAQMIGAALLQGQVEASGGELTHWLAIAAVLLLQLPLLLVFYFSRRFFPGQYASRLNSNHCSIGQAMAQAAPIFLRFLPVIWIVSFAWTQVLSLAQHFGWIGEFPPQELVKLFQAGGDPLAIGLLVLFAVLLAPLVEELIFRGCIYRFFKSKTTRVSAQIISAVLFASVHANLLSFVPLVLVGILLARTYEKTGNILAPICFHAFFNGFSLLMLLIMSQSQLLNP